MFWKNRDWEKEDPHLKSLDSMPFQRPFPFVPELNNEKGLYIIRGPRQVGKTSWLKKILSEHAKKGADCYYISCEEIENYNCLLYTSPSPRDATLSRMPSSA